MIWQRNLNVMNAHTGSTLRRLDLQTFQSGTVGLGFHPLRAARKWQNTIDSVSGIGIRNTLRIYN